MAKGYTLDIRPFLYGEPRLSDAQVTLLRQLQAGANAIHNTPTSDALLGRLMIHLETQTSSGWIAGLTERGRKTLADIDAAAKEGR